MALAAFVRANFSAGHATLRPSPGPDEGTFMFAPPRPLDIPPQLGYRSQFYSK